MPLARRTSLALVLAVAGAPAAAGAIAAPAAVAQTTPDACKQPLNPDRRSVYRFKNGKTTLSFGRIVVTATKANRHRYCIQAQYGGRRVYHAFGQTGYERRNGKWVNVGGLGDSGSVGGAFQQTMQVPDKYRIDHSYGIRYQGRWYWTIAISRYNL